ncbi:MAG TPA: hypothetical protein VNA30_02330 [Mycobacteriales bacterium]|nr:hypothetical protein [Mycobacteriales bacterium]
MARRMPTKLRLGVLAVSVLHDLDVLPTTRGVALPGTPDVYLSWRECREAIAGADPETPEGHARLAEWLLTRRWAASLSREELLLRLRPVGLPVGHVLCPGPGWVQEKVRGGALELGLGAVDLDPADPDRVVMLPPPVLTFAGIDTSLAWLAARTMLEELGTLASLRVRTCPMGLLRPLGDCDAVTLLGARSLRTALANAAGGMGTAVVPMRRRGWTKLAMIDPAFGPAAAAATRPEDRGFARPLLTTADELTLVAQGGRPERLALLDPAATDPRPRDVLYR